jgi:CheY-like chemotaxis protein
MQSSSVIKNEKKLKRVLIVDDNHDVADSLAQWLSLAGHDVHTAYTGAEAVEKVPALKPDIILLDIGLPDINGYEVAKRLRALVDVPPFTLVAVTGYGHPSDSDVFRKAGFDEYFSKPMHSSKFKAIGLEL